MSTLAADALANLLGGTLAGFATKQAVRADAPAFPKLANKVHEIARVLDVAAAPFAPPAQQRREAFSRLLRAPDSMGSQDWKHLAWGLSDAYDGVRVLEHERAFPLIRDGFEQRLAAGRLTRRMWFGLLSSYFSWRPATGAGLAGWAWLRAFVQRAFAHMKESARAVRTWMSVVDRHQDVFGDTPGARLGEALARLDTQALEEFRSCLHVPADSWFWHAMVDAQLSHVSQLRDTDFEARIAPMLELAAQLPTMADALLAGLLTRYETSLMRDQPHPALRMAALERWGSPQIGSSRNRWSVAVAEPVCKMVMRWFAKEDLETFFKLLQGESGVDQDRLDYWLRFVGQIGYTRIVMGAQAERDQSSDFVEFRRKNADRISVLVRGGTPDDNAFLMQIGNYLITEFSKKGNACYIRPLEAVPFKLGKRELDFNFDLKNRRSTHDRLPHTKGSWQSNYDSWLAGRGVFPDAWEAGRKDTRKAPVTLPSDLSKGAVPPKISSVVGSASFFESGGRGSVDASIQEALRYVCELVARPKTSDSRSKGGAFWIELQSTSPAMERKLLALGFKHAAGRGFWIK